jgi:ABC-type transporter Mla subunit MlaD
VDRDEIERTSEHVRRILEAAEASAEQIRAEAAGDVARLEQAARELQSRIGDVERELGGVVADLRRSAERLAEGLAGLHETAAEAPAEPAPEAQGDGDEAGARLTALNMALGGTPREETARYLAEHYALADPEALLDDVYDRAGG